MCRTCWEPFLTHVSQIDRGQGKFCSRTCAGAWHFPGEKRRLRAITRQIVRLRTQAQATGDQAMLERAERLGAYRIWLLRAAPWRRMKAS